MASCAIARPVWARAEWAPDEIDGLNRSLDAKRANHGRQSVVFSRACELEPAIIMAT